MSVLSGRTGTLYSIDSDGNYIYVGTVDSWEITYVDGSFRLVPPEANRG